MNIGIIGKGFVGSAVEYGFLSSPNIKYNIRIYDKKTHLRTHSLEDTVNESEIVFLSVPTPANTNGSINLNIIDQALNEINFCTLGESIILIRSTLIPGTTKMFQKKYPKIKMVFNPEFLSEKNADYDFVNQSRIILGGNTQLTSIVSQLYKLRFDNSIPIIETNFETAEMIKYINNCFLATKVSFMNEMKMISDKSGVDWDVAVNGFSLDKRVGDSHLDVPGHDGKLGFGGSCFPKDIQALIHHAQTIGIEVDTLKGAWKTNLKVRPEKDWEELKGRAITDEI